VCSCVVQCVQRHSLLVGMHLLISGSLMSVQKPEACPHKKKKSLKQGDLTSRTSRQSTASTKTTCVTTPRPRPLPASSASPSNPTVSHHPSPSCAAAVVTRILDAFHSQLDLAVDEERLDSAYAACRSQDATFSLASLGACLAHAAAKP
jgi:hypothetical protein